MIDLFCRIRQKRKHRTEKGICYILGGAPSIKRMDLLEFTDGCIIPTNHAIHHTDLSHINFRYYVLPQPWYLAPGMFGRKDSKEAQKRCTYKTATGVRQKLNSCFACHEPINPISKWYRMHPCFQVILWNSVFADVSCNQRSPECWNLSRSVPWLFWNTFAWFRRNDLEESNHEREMVSKRC